MGCRQFQFGVNNLFKCVLLEQYLNGNLTQSDEHQLHFHIRLTVSTHLVKLHSELSSTFQRRGERIQVLTPEGEEFLNAQAAQRVVAGVADSVLLADRHHFVVHVQGVLWRAKGEQNHQMQPVDTEADSNAQTHLDRDVEHEPRFPCVRHAHHSDPVSVANTHLLKSHGTETHVGIMSGQFLHLFHCHPDRTDSERRHSGSSSLLPYRTWKGSGPVS